MEENGRGGMMVYSSEGEWREEKDGVGWGKGKMKGRRERRGDMMVYSSV